MSDPDTTSDPVRPPRRDFLPFSPPSIGPEEIDEVVDTLRSDWITTGPKTKAFETAFGSYLGAPGGTSLMLNSCTAGLHLALAALGIGPGDEVIVPALTFAATANVVEHVGAKPVFADVEPDTLCLDPDSVAAAVTSATKVVMPVHYAGHPADLDAIDALARHHGLHVVEDAAHAAPTWYRGARIGARDNFAAFSFYATKNLTTAEGGALTAAPELLEKARVLGLHGMSRDAWKLFARGCSWAYDIVAPGYKNNMTDIQASLGIHQLTKLAGFHRRRQGVVRRYTAAFAAVDALEPPTERDDVVSSWHLYVLRLRPGAPVDRARRLHRGADGPQPRHERALPAGAHDVLLCGVIRARTRGVPGGPRRVRAHALHSTSPSPDRRGRRRRHRRGPRHRRSSPGSIDGPTRVRPADGGAWVGAARPAVRPGGRGDPCHVARGGLLPPGAGGTRWPTVPHLPVPDDGRDAEARGGQLTVAGDARVTPLGSLLRRHKIDELPQLINVNRGEMSLVGPRPEVPRYVSHYDERERRVLSVRPGITDPASIAFRDENELLATSDDPEATYLRDVMPRKLAMNLAYLERRSLGSDIAVILKTLLRLVRG